MHVTRVELENIKSYSEGERRGDFRFERGTTAIVGPNGAGKTTILEAVAWALFDVLDYSKEDFLRRGAKRGSVRVTFQSDLDERLYTVYRDTGTGYYVYDPELRMKLQQGKADVRKWLDQHLGVEPGTDLRALFRSAIGVPQGLFTTDFLQTPTDRKKSFDRLLKVEEYREGAERLRDTVNLINERIAEARGRISGAESQLARYDATAAEHKAARGRGRAGAADAGRMTASAEAEVRRLDESLERSRQARATLVELEKDVGVQEELERERERLRDLLAQARAAGERLSRLDAELGALRRAHTETSRRVHAAEDLADASARADKLESERMDVETRLSRVEQALTSRKHLTSQRRETAREAERLRRSVTALEHEAREFDQAAAAAARLPELEERRREVTQAAPRLHAP